MGELVIVKTLFTISVIIFIIYEIIKWANKRKDIRKGDLTDEIEATEKNNEHVDKSENDQSNRPIKRINFPVVGLNYEGRRKLLTDIINQHKKEDLFVMDRYEGLTNKEILGDYFSERIYELTYESLSDCVLEKENDNKYDPNALMVLIQDPYYKYHHIGYVPKEYCVEIRELMDKYKMLIGNTITGGKYKVVDYDDMGNEKVRIRTLKYGLNLSVSFWDK